MYKYRYCTSSSLWFMLWNSSWSNTHSCDMILVPRKMRKVVARNQSMFQVSILVCGILIGVCLSSALFLLSSSSTAVSPLSRRLEGSIESSTKGTDNVLSLQTRTRHSSHRSAFDPGTRERATRMESDSCILRWSGPSFRHYDTTHFLLASQSMVQPVSTRRACQSLASRQTKGLFYWFGGQRSSTDLQHVRTRNKLRMGRFMHWAKQRVLARIVVPKMPGGGGHRW